MVSIDADADADDDDQGHLPQAGGYSTHLVGKWHLGYCNKKFLPTRQDGCDDFYGQGL